MPWPQKRKTAKPNENISKFFSTKKSRSSKSNANEPVETVLASSSSKRLKSTECSQNLKDFSYSPPSTSAVSKRKQNLRSKNDNLQIVPFVNEETPLSKKLKYTPLEEQYLELRKLHPDIILAIECGYKYRFFGEDAEVASRELNIGCFQNHNFMSASIPSFRLHVHLRHLVANGHKVGVVKQTETTALKALGDNKNTIFTRQLSSLYSKSTLIGEDITPITMIEDEVDPNFICESVNEFLMSVSEVASEINGSINIGIMIVQPSTGDLIYKTFTDNSSRAQLESYITMIQPVEILIPESLLSNETEKLIRYTCSLSTSKEDSISLVLADDEYFKEYFALQVITEFFSHSTDALAFILSFPPILHCCLSGLIFYLKKFNLDRILSETSSFIELSNYSDCISLNAATIRNLELFKNLTTFTRKGSLMWVIDYTSTKFGSRLLHQWLSSPLKDERQILERQDIVNEMVLNMTPIYSEIKKLFYKLPDLERALGSVYHQKASPHHFLLLSEHLYKIHFNLSALQAQIESEIASIKLKEILQEISDLLKTVHNFLKNVNPAAARENDKTNLFVDVAEFEEIVACRRNIEQVLENLENLKPKIAETLNLPAFQFSCVSGQEFLIEVPNRLTNKIPKDWLKISATKQVSRFHSPEIVKLYKKLQIDREQHSKACSNAWIQFLRNFSTNFASYRRAMKLLAEIDCYFSIAEFSRQPGYCRPLMKADSSEMVIKQGRNPIVEKLLGNSEQYVANNTNLNPNINCLIITGPNMGGKSSYIRQVALMAILAQIGSYVPAESATLSILDGIFIRMGAADNLAQSQSTFFVEMSEASEILARATSKSLVILDELGRGTATHDGLSIAYSTLSYILHEIKCLVLFVTHYPEITELEKLFPCVRNYHMSFIVNSDEVPDSLPVFLYQLCEGASDRSYGLNVAALAGIEKSIINEASKKATEIEESTNLKRLGFKFLQQWNLNF